MYAPHPGKSDEEKENVWNLEFQIVSSISLGELVVTAGDINDHVGQSIQDMHGGFGYGIRNTEGPQVLVC